MTEKYTPYAAMDAGFESTVSRELQKLGYQTRNESSRVFPEGGQENIAKTNLWLGSADRVKILPKEFKVISFEQLYDEAYDYDWALLLPVDVTFPVQGRAVRSKLHSESGVQSIVKKVIVDKMVKQYHRCGFLPETGNAFPLGTHIYKDVARLSPDTTGASLLKRDYRVERGGAPLKETFAAGLLELTPFSGTHPLVDPMCGSGTLPIEATLLVKDIAPGIKHEFSFDGFDWFDKKLHQADVEQAQAQIEPLESTIWASDIDQSVLEYAKLNAHNAGVLQDIKFKQVAAKDFRTDLESGIIISNPPYGKRLKDRDGAHRLHEEMGQALGSHKDFSQYYLTSDPDFERYFGQKAARKRKLFNGNLRVDFYRFWANKR